MTPRTTRHAMAAIAMLGLLLTASAADAATVLLGGFHGQNETAQQSPSISNVDVVLTSTTGDITQGFSQISSLLWGTQSLDAAPTDDNSPAAHAIVQQGTVTPFTLTLTITNNESSNLLLDSLHFIVKKDVNNQGPQNFTVAYTAGDLGAAANTLIALPNGITGFDVNIGAGGLGLSDTTLSNGESATFTWTPGAPQDSGGNTAIRIDNFAISGEVLAAIPAPTALPAGLAVLGLVAMRRKR